MNDDRATSDHRGRVRRQEALGAETLDSETATNVSAGVDWRLGGSGGVGVNVYQIDVDDRIVLSNYLSGDEVADVLAARGITDVVAARYLFNGPDTRTRGVDLTGDWRWNSGWGPVQFDAGLNLNDTEVTGVVRALPTNSRTYLGLSIPPMPG